MVFVCVFVTLRLSGRSMINFSICPAVLYLYFCLSGRSIKTISHVCHIFWPTSWCPRSNPSTYLESSDHGGCYKTICSCLTSKIKKFCQWQPFSKLWKNCHSEHVLPTHVIPNNVLLMYVIPNTSEQRGRRRRPICEYLLNVQVGKVWTLA